MKKYTKILFSLALGIGAWLVVQAQQAPSPPTTLPTPPTPPKNLPKFPSFNTGGDNGKYQFVTAEYYALDTQKKWFLYKQLVKADTTTGEAWVLQSSRNNAGEFSNKWVPLIK